MPIYVYKCESGHVSDEFMQKFTPPKTVVCPTCSKKAKRFYGGETVNTDLVNNERYSDAMGVTEEQIPEAMRTFPGSEYDSTGRLLIKNRKHKLAEMKRRGYVEFA